VRTELFDYELPERLIATRPPTERDGGRMCIVREDGVHHDWVRNLPEQIEPGDLVVLNDTRVRRARLICSRPPRVGRGGETAGGAQVELLFLHPLGEGRWAALGRANRPLRPGDQLLAEGLVVRIVERDAEGTLCIDTEGDVEAALERSGHMPVPPYLQRPGDAEDVTRYQTVFARNLGSAAAPTAGLHLTDEALARMKARGAEIARITLHIGIGTFRPVSVDDLDAHAMHEEWIEVDADLAAAITRTRERGGRVVAIGTTVVRALESAASPALRGHVTPTTRSTGILIQPGYEFRVVDALLTNFHMPKSTLMALVSAFAGRPRILAAYATAVAENYRFLSYGDAMWLPTRLA